MCINNYDKILNYAKNMNIEDKVGGIIIIYLIWY